MISVISLLLGLVIGYWVGKPNKITTAVKRQILGRQAKIVDMDDPIKDIDLGYEEI